MKQQFRLGCHKTKPERVIACHGKHSQKLNCKKIHVPVVALILVLYLIGQEVGANVR